MDTAYLKSNRREYELVKHISLGSRFGRELIELVTTGKTIVTLTEGELFDRHGWPRLRLGPHILRAETAAVVGGAMMVLRS